MHSSAKINLAFPGIRLRHAARSRPGRYSRQQTSANHDYLPNVHRLAKCALFARYQILYFQLSGFTDISTAKINLFFNLGNAFGMLLGGVLGDAAAKRFPRTARPAINMASMLVAGPLNLVLYRAMPGAAQHQSPASCYGAL